MSEGAGTRRRVAGTGGFGPDHPSARPGRSSPATRLAPPGDEACCLAPGVRVHMVGIGGCGMRGAAAVLLRRGAVVTVTEYTVVLAGDTVIVWVVCPPGLHKYAL